MTLRTKLVARLNFFQNKPKATKIDVSEYLERLKLKRQDPSLAYLKKLQKAHLTHIPFENLDIHYGSKIKLDYQAIFKKLISRQRGGICYELNGLFYHLLYHLGYDCYIISAEVYNHDTETFGKPFDHLAICVILDDQPWLADVGFGDGIINPIEIDVGKVQMDYHRYWRLDIDPDERLLLRESPDTNYFKTQYRFTLKERQLIEFLNMLDYHQDSPESPFTQRKLVTRLTESGRVTLTNRELKIREFGEVHTTDVLHEDDFLSKLYYHFDIDSRNLSPIN